MANLVKTYESYLADAKRAIAKFPQRSAYGMTAHDYAIDAWLRDNDVDMVGHRKPNQSPKRSQMFSRDAMVRDLSVDAPDMESLIDLSRTPAPVEQKPTGLRTPERVARAQAKRRETLHRKEVKLACPEVATAKLDAFVYGLAQLQAEIARKLAHTTAVKMADRARRMARQKAKRAAMQARVEV